MLVLTPEHERQGSNAYEIVHLGCESTGAQPSPACCLLDLLVLLLSRPCVANDHRPVVSDVFSVTQHVEHLWECPALVYGGEHFHNGSAHPADT